MYSTSTVSRPACSADREIQRTRRVVDPRTSGWPLLSFPYSLEASGTGEGPDSRTS